MRLPGKRSPTLNPNRVEAGLYFASRLVRAATDDEGMERTPSRNREACHPCHRCTAVTGDGLIRHCLERRIPFVHVAESPCSGELTRAYTVPFRCNTDTGPRWLPRNLANASGAGVDGSVAYFVMATRTNRRLSSRSPARGSKLARNRLATLVGYRAMAGGPVGGVSRHREIPRPERTGIPPCGCIATCAKNRTTRDNPKRGSGTSA